MIEKQPVLFAVTGMSPAILTETVWTLAHENPPVPPDLVVVLTSTADHILEVIRTSVEGY